MKQLRYYLRCLLICDLNVLYITSCRVSILMIAYILMEKFELLLNKCYTNDRIITTFDSL